MALYLTDVPVFPRCHPSWLSRLILFWGCILQCNFKQIYSESCRRLFTGAFFQKCIFKTLLSKNFMSRFLRFWLWFHFFFLILWIKKTPVLTKQRNYACPHMSCIFTLWFIAFIYLDLAFLQEFNSIHLSFRIAIYQGTTNNNKKGRKLDLRICPESHLKGGNGQLVAIYIFLQTFPLLSVIAIIERSFWPFAPAARFPFS